MNTLETTAIPSTFNVEQIRSQFPILQQKIYGNKPLVYLDNAATTQKPQSVIDCIIEYYTGYNANIHRGVHFLSQKASKAFDEVRDKIQHRIHAESPNEIVFTRGTTDSVNLVASTYGRSFIGKGDEILISAMEHHSNIVPWQMLCEEKRAVLKVIPMNAAGELLIDEFEKLLSSKTKIVSVVYISNSLGTINPVKHIIEKSHAVGAVVMLDAAQAMAHEPIDVQELDCDFLASSAHKFYGPTGAGFLYGKIKHLEAMPPYQGGGDMISSVKFEKTTYNTVPFKFEAGTPHIEGVIAMGAAIDFLSKLDLDAVKTHEQALVAAAMKGLSEIPRIKLIGTAKNKASVVSFIIEGANALDAGLLLDTMGIAVRTGQHCTEPAMDCLGIPGTIRASFAVYNTMDDVKSLLEGVSKVVRML